MGRNTNIVRVPVLNGEFFRYWLDFLQHFHKLTAREMDVLAALLQERHELSKVIKDEDILDKVLFSDDIKKKIKETCNMNRQHFQVVLSNLRKSGLIINNKINKKMIPSIDEGAKEYNLIFRFEL